MHNLPHPLGTRLQLCKPTGEWYDTNLPMKPTGIYGVIEIFRAGDLFPANQVWRTPGIGEIVVRYLKKDGTKSAKCDRRNSGLSGLDWRPL